MGERRGAPLLGLVAIYLAVAACAEAQRPNSHSVAVRQPACVPGECVCTGRVDPRARLNESGPRADELRRGVRCIAADFDGNGAIDYALPGAEGMATVILSARNGGFLRAVTLDAGGMLQLYAPRATPGADGEPPAKLHGILVPWVGQDHVVFLWDGEGFARRLFRSRDR